VLEFESVGDGFTGPMDRREAAKCGSWASRSMTVFKGSLLVWRHIINNIRSDYEISTLSSIWDSSEG
jgi:hypothetical protein